MIKNVAFVCYPESLPNNIENIIKLNSNIRKYAYILHDKDLDDNGDLKKPHYHVVLEYEKSTQKEYIAKNFGISSELINPCKNKIGYIIYMSHINECNKVKYDINEIISNYDITQIYSMYFNGLEDEDARVRKVIQKSQEIGSLVELVNWALDNGCYKELKSNYWIIRDIRARRDL